VLLKVCRKNSTSAPGNRADQARAADFKPGRRKTPTGIIEIQWSCFSSSRSSRLFVAHNGLRTPSSSYS
jgi:hypothetical protein